MSTLSTGLQIQQKIPGFMPNLFEVSIFGEDGSGNSSFPFTEYYTGADASKSSQYYCTAYELPAPALGFKRDPLSKKFYAEKYTIPETVSITWQENQELQVWKYHQDWLRCFYNRETDQFISGSSGKKRNAHITIQRYNSNQTDFLSTDLINTYTIKLAGLIPQSLPPLRGDWNQDASNSMGLAIKYYVDYVAILDPTDTFTGAQ